VRLKRIFAPETGARLRALGEIARSATDADTANAAIAEREKLGRNVAAIEIQRLSPKWRPTPQLVERGAAEGWLSLAAGELKLATTKGEVRYKIVAPPDRAKGLHFYECEVIR
jgi:hypothetical protein